MPTIKAGEVNLEYYVEGDGPPLLMIMGFAGQANSWGEPIMTRLRKRFTCIRFSNRGTGASDRPDTPFTIRMMADDAIALLDALDIRQPHVFGISMGGMISQEIVLNYPERVNGLVLGCTTPGFAHGEMAAPEVTAAMTPQPGLSVEEMVRNFWTAVCAPAFIEDSAEFLDEMIATNLKQATSMDTIMKQAVAIQTFDSFDRLSQIKAPTLVIHGDIDRLIPPANGDVLAGGIAGAEKLTLNGAAHMFFWEQPAETADAIIEFLARVPAEV
ncbi:MAG: alpha/beta fold hydrolase [Chloroflexi bacterium]|nr:alpha/beta fold hydrolase [Chloroflexota bacterium]